MRRLAVAVHAAASRYLCAAAFPAAALYISFPFLTQVQRRRRLTVISLSYQMPRLSDCCNSVVVGRISGVILVSGPTFLSRLSQRAPWSLTLRGRARFQACGQWRNALLQHRIENMLTSNLTESLFCLRLSFHFLIPPTASFSAAEHSTRTTESRRPHTSALHPVSLPRKPPRTTAAACRANRPP